MSDTFDYQNLVPAFGAQPPSPRFRLGTVSAIATNYTISVQIAGSSTVLTGIKYLANVQPLVGSPVWIVSDGTDLFAFGVLAADGRMVAPRVNRSTDLGIPDATDQAITWDAVNNDSYGTWNAGSPTRLTAPLTGRYVATATVAFAGNAAGFRALWIEKTGTLTLARAHTLSVGGGSPTWMNITTPPFDMIAGQDYIRCLVRQNSGLAINITQSSTFSPAMGLVYLGP